MENIPVGYTRLTASDKITPDACLFYGLIQLDAVAAAAVTVYDGRDASSGRLVGTFAVGAGDSKVRSLPAPLYLANGLYVALAANVTEVTVFWLPAGKG